MAFARESRGKTHLEAISKNIHNLLDDRSNGGYDSHMFCQGPARKARHISPDPRTSLEVFFLVGKIVDRSNV